MFATSVTRPPHKLVCVANMGLAGFFRCKEAVKLRQVAVGFALDSELKDKVSPETRYWEKLRDHGKMGLEIFVQRLETNITLGRHPPAWEWRRCLYPFKSIRREIKYKPFHEAEAYLKDVDKRIHHILNETTTNCSFICVAVAFHKRHLWLCNCGRTKRTLKL